LDFQIRPLAIRRSPDVILHGWKSETSLSAQNNKVLIYFGGRMEDVWWAPKMASHFEGWTIYAFNYRGFGESTGCASEKNAKSDAQAIFDYARTQHPEPKTKWALMGRSLGTTFAIWLAHKVQPARLVLASPFCSMRSVLDARFRHLPGASLIGGRLENSKCVADITAKTLIVLAGEDRTIEHSDSMNLAAKFGNTPVIAKIVGTNHKTVIRSPVTQKAVASFLAETATDDLIGVQCF
jgi:pimeloyl-ACP methyl ester carboxylesterase